MIYIPNKDSYSCVVVQNEEVIRAYEETPRNNSTINYRDFYINSDYIYKDGYQTFSQYTTLPVCINSNEITSDLYYRLDLDKILIIFIIMCIFCFLIPIKIFKRLFRRLN